MRVSVVVDLAYAGDGWFLMVNAGDHQLRSEVMPKSTALALARRLRAAFRAGGHQVEHGNSR